MCLDARQHKSLRRFFFSHSVAMPIYKEIVFSSANLSYLLHGDEGRKWFKLDELQVLPVADAKTQPDTDSVEAAPGPMLMEWKTRESFVLANYHVHGTSIAKSSAHCSVCESKVSVPVAKAAGRKRKHGEVDDNNDIGVFLQQHPRHVSFLSQFPASTLSCVRDGKYVPLTSFLPFDARKALKFRKSSAYSWTIGDDGSPTLEKASQERKLDSFRAFASAYFRYGRLLTLFHPKRQDDVYDFFDVVVDWLDSTATLAGVAEYFERFRYSHPDRRWCDIDHARLHCLYQHATASVTPRRSVKKATKVDKRSRTIRDKAFDACRKAGVCGKFQFGLCKETGPHMLGGEMVQHQCIHCSGPHALDDCTDKSSF